MSKKKNTGNRYNKGKLRWRNFPLFLIKPLIEVAAQGEEKYGTYNYLDGQTANDLLDSNKRHMEKLESPFESDYDKESKLHHAAHMAWNSLVLVYMLVTRPDLDDRYKIKKK